MSEKIKVTLIKAGRAVCCALIGAASSFIVSMSNNNHVDDIIDTINTKNENASVQIAELQSDMHDLETKYSVLQERYNTSINQYDELEQAYKELNKNVQRLLIEAGHTDSNVIETETRWLDQLDIFYQEGKHISGIDSQGWCKMWDSSLHKDSLGNEHNHGICFRGYREDTYIIEYALDDAYIGFKGLFTLEYGSRNTQIESNFKVYKIDDNNNSEKELLYSTPQSLCGGVKPISFDFPLQGADHIRIEISSNSGEKGEFLLALVDARFYK